MFKTKKKSYFKKLLKFNQFGQKLKMYLNTAKVNILN